jgi:hypothetical protein
MPAAPRPLPLGATATLVVERTAADSSSAVIPASALTQSEGQPAVWVVRRADAAANGTVELIHADVHGYKSDEVLISVARRIACVRDDGRAKRLPDCASHYPKKPRSRTSDEISSISPSGRSTTARSSCS